jgi:hypothetical protein
MSIEERLSESLARNLDQLEVPAGDVGAARRAGERQRRQRTWTTGLAAAAAVLAVVATGVVVSRSGDEGHGRLDPASPTGSWTRLPDAPISPRTRGIAVWTGTEAIFLGGQIDHLCPPSADCADMPVYAKDGAAYDPAAQTWRTIAPSPVPVAAYTLHAVLGDELVLVGDDGSWHAYDASDDQWRDLPAQPDAQPYPGQLSALDGKVYLLGRRGAVQVLDLHSESWSTLPPSSHQPRLDAYSVVATPEGVVVTGRDSTALQDGTVPIWTFAEVYDGESWRRLARSDMVGGSWHWTGERLVAPALDCIDGGEVNPYPRCIPEGGILDPLSGTWSELADAPEPGEGGWALPSAGGGPMMTTYGYVYDDSAGTWTKLSRPTNAPDHDSAGVWADGTLIAFGGLDSEKGWDKDALSNKAWAWTP